MKINKYNVVKSDSTTSRVQGSGLLVNTASGYNSEVSTEAKKLAETHLIFGLPFNGTLDISGDINNALNINASGGDLTVAAEEDDEGVNGGNITADGDITAGNNVIGKKFIGDVEAEDVTTTNLTAESGAITSLKGETLTFDSADIKSAVIEALNSVDITTENLTVTKLAHFFQLVIDKIKAAGGAIILSPADGFKVDLVQSRIKTDVTQYRLCWKATDGEKSISNMWLAGDLALCLTFNAAEGTSYNVSNKYYWALVLAAGTASINDEDYHYIIISSDDYDGTLNPEAGDEIAMLGYRGDDEDRQSAIYISAYSSVDPSLKAPLICQYKGINDYHLESHKYSYLAANGNEIRGSLKVESGLTVEEYVDYQAITIVSSVVEYAASSSYTTVPSSGWSTSIPYIAPANYLWTRTTVTYSDGTVTVAYSVARSGSNGKKGDTGDAGADGNSYTANLLYNTQNFDGDKWVNSNYWTDTNDTYFGCKVLKRESNAYGIYQDFEAVAGQTYTFSAFIKSDGGDVRFYFQIDGGGTVTPLNKDVPESSEWTRLAVTFKCTESGVVRCRVQKATGTGAVYIAGFKLELGENPNTVWTPAASEIVGKDADYYKLEPLIEKALVDSSLNLNISLKYQIVHIVGSSASTVTASSGGYYVRFKDNTQSTYTALSYSSTPLYTKDGYVTEYASASNPVQYLEIQLMNGSDILNRRIVPITLAAVATFEITDKITARVQSSEDRLDEVETDVTTVTLAAKGLTSTVKSLTTTVNKLDGTVEEHTTQISTLEQTAEGLKSTVESHTEDIEGNKDSISVLELTAEQIQLQVNEVSIKVDSQKIVLDGNTEINGSLIMDNTELGFILKGDSGTTYIQPLTVGTYSDFTSKSSNKTYLSSLFTCYLSNNSVSQNDNGYLTYNGSYTFKQEIGTLASGTYILFTDLTLSYSASDSNDVVCSSRVYTLYNDDTAVKTYTASADNVSGQLFNFTTTSEGTYSIKVVTSFKATRAKPSSDTTTIIANSVTVKGTLKFAVILPTTAFMLIGYDGIAVNFGNNKTAYIGSDEATFRYGDNALKVSADGVQKLDPNGSGSWTGLGTKKVKLITADYTLEDDVDMVIYALNSNSVTLTLPYPAVTGRTVYVKDRSSGSIVVYNANSRLILAAANSVTSKLTLNNLACFFVFDGSYWLLFYCG